MSLIDDALKKVSEEAARRDALSQGAPIPYAPARGAERRRFRRGFAIGIGAGLLVALVCVVALLIRPGTRPRPKAAASAPPAKTSALPPVTEEVIVPPPPGIKASAPPVAPRPVSAAAAPRPRPARAPAAPVTSQPRIASGIPANGASYPARLDLPDGSAIELDGIVYSDTKPVALVNGRVLVAGDFVFDYRIVKIERDRIALEGRGTSFTMTMH